jgi:hypothetical protein
MINNLDLLRPLIKIPEGYFLSLFVWQRKKDQELPDKHQSVRTIKYYNIKSVEYLESKMDEIIHLCEHFKARAYLNLNPVSYRELSFNVMKALAENLKSGNYLNTRLFESQSDLSIKQGDIWIVDVDDNNLKLLADVVEVIAACRPEGANKLLGTVPTKSGYHLLTKRFDVKQFSDYQLDVEIKKCNPTVLVIPDSILN